MADMVGRLNAVHGKLLALHKALIEWERERYEAVNGPVESPYSMLNLLINDPQFAWLRRMSEVIVQIDEVASSKEEIGPDAGEAILRQVRGLIEDGEGEFQGKYQEAVKGDAEVRGLDGELRAVVG